MLEAESLSKFLLENYVNVIVKEAMTIEKIELESKNDIDLAEISTQYKGKSTGA